MKGYGVPTLPGALWNLDTLLGGGQTTKRMHLHPVKFRDSKLGNLEA